MGGRGSPGSPAGSASYHSASDSANSNSAAGSASIHHPAVSDGQHQHQAPLTEQLQSRLVQLNESLYKAPIGALYTTPFDTESDPPEQPGGLFVILKSNTSISNAYISP